MRTVIVSLWVASLLVTACYSGLAGSDPTTETDAEGSTGTTTDAPADGSSTVASTTSTTVDPDGTTTVDPDGTTDESTGAPPAEPGIHWVGRFDDTDPAGVRMGWSGVGLVARFDGTGATVRMDDAGRYFTVLVDGMLQPTLATSTGMQDYVLASGLPAGEHVIELYRRTEGSFGPTVIEQVTIDGELLAPPPVARRMEIIGDSISCGYGNEGVSPCSFSAQTENHYMTYGAIAARAVGAELHTVAWSGKGMVYNFGDDVNQPLPELYDRTIASSGDPWSFDWQPDVVAVNLGTNDFSTDGDPPQPLFTDAYVEFLGHLRDVYPGAFLLVLQPSLFGAENDMVQGYLMDVVAQVQAGGDSNVAYADVNVTWIGSGCDGHPTVATHEGMAGRLVQELQAHLGW
ncbi:SGNH/GDSL hydrolase family protein [Paraliomyxa miuraensis]|uniref:SGNH/GDSL hydrolase family protein n=1 Tax=Paraliomyxa miuraensis TaxID=376150 RepID=UPI0022594B15|nr:SGNH/GDSL hydrolase family protein [Paraliomyxa miuraensis]MCX4240664.1 GDSL-type esterase/lipase family protein [Paraliomyxa miuraensis]